MPDMSKDSRVTDHDLLRQMAHDISLIRFVIMAYAVVSIVAAAIIWASYQPT